VGRAGEFIQMPIDSKGLIDARVPPPLLSLPSSHSLSLSLFLSLARARALFFVIHRTAAIFVAGTGEGTEQ
jgi:hypothetical protein